MALVATLEAEAGNVRLDYTVPAGGATLTLSRTGPSGTPAAVRGWDGAEVVAGAVIARDFEAPLGVPLTYTATTLDAGGAVIDTSTAAVTVPAGACGAWLNDLARVANTMRVLVESLPELTFGVPATVHEILARRSPIVSSDVAHTPGFELSFLTETLEERDRARATLGNGVPVLLRTDPEQGIGNLYFAVLGYSEQRIVTDGLLPDRRFKVTARQVERPDPELYAPVGVATYQHVTATFATYADLLAGRSSYDAVLYDWAGSEASDIVPWPPVDV